MFLSAVGVALSIRANIGTAVLSCPSYVFNLEFPGISVGTFSILLNILFILIQIGVMRKDYKPKYFFQLIAIILFGYMIDISLALLSFATPVTMAGKLGFVFLSCAFTALGISMEVAADAWMLSVDLAVWCIQVKSGWKFRHIKITVDFLVVLSSAIFSFIFFQNFLGNGEYNVIGLGTVIMAMFTGYFMKFTDPLAKKML